MTTQNAVLTGRMEADKQQVIGWGIFGFLLAILAIPIVYLRSPKIKTETLSEQNENTDLATFELAYVNHLKGRQVKAAWIGFLCAILLFIAIGIMGNNDKTTTSPQSDVQPKKDKSLLKKVLDSGRIVTSKEYAQIKDGMSYKQVVAIIGAEGKEMSRSTFMNITTVMYSWENNDLSNMNAMFQNNKLVSKAHFGL